MVYSLPGVEVSSNELATVKISHRGEEGHHTFHWEFTVKFEVMQKISLHSSKLNHIVNTNIYIHEVEFCFTYAVAEHFQDFGKSAQNQNLC